MSRGGEEQSWGRARPGAKCLRGGGRGSCLCRRSHFLGAGFVALHKPGANPKLTSVSQRGRRRQERERWAKRTARTPRPAPEAGRTRRRLRDTPKGGPHPSPTGERGPAWEGARRPHQSPSGRHHHRTGNPQPGPPPHPQGLRARATPRPRGLPTRAANPGARARPGAFVPSPMALSPSPTGAGGQEHPRTPRTQTQRGAGPGRCAGALRRRSPPCGGRDLGWVLSGPPGASLRAPFLPGLGSPGSPEMALAEVKPRAEGKGLSVPAPSALAR